MINDYYNSVITIDSNAFRNLTGSDDLRGGKLYRL